MKKKIVGAIAGVGLVAGAYGLGQSDALSNQAGANKEEKAEANEEENREVPMTEKEMDEKMGIPPKEERITLVKAKAAVEIWEKRKTEFKFENDDVEKVAMQKFLLQKTSGQSNINIAELREEAAKKVKFDRAWVKLAKERYGVEVSEEEIDTVIRDKFNNGNIQDQEMEVWARALGKTVQEMVKSDRGSMERLLLWENLIPRVAKKHDLNRSEFEPSKKHSSFDNKVKAIYFQEVGEYIKKFRDM